MSNREPFTLKMPYVPSVQTWEEYALCCTDIANFARNRISHLSRPSAIDFSDTTKFRKISETAYEAIIPLPSAKEEATALFERVYQELSSGLHPCSVGLVFRQGPAY